MAQHLIPWNVGGGNIVVEYIGHNDETVIVRSDSINLGDDRTQTLTLRTTTGNGVAEVTVTQPTGMQVLMTSDNKILRDSNGNILRVYPHGYAPS